MLMVVIAAMQAQQALELASGKLYSYHNLWQALQDPGATVEWVVVNPQNSVDLVGQRLKADPGMLSQFTPYVRQSDGVLLYHHVGRGPLPTRPAPARWQGAPYSCARA